MLIGKVKRSTVTEGALVKLLLKVLWIREFKGKVITGERQIGRLRRGEGEKVELNVAALDRDVKRRSYIKEDAVEILKVLQNGMLINCEVLIEEQN